SLSSGGRRSSSTVGPGGQWRRHHHRFQSNFRFGIRARSTPPQIFRRDMRVSNNMRRNYDKNFLILGFHVLLRSKVTQERNIRESRPAGNGFAIRPLDQAAEDINFAVLQPNIVLDFPRADHRLTDSAYILLAGNRGNLYRKFQADFAIVGMASGSH